MVKHFLLITLLLIAGVAHAQNVGIGTTTPNASAQLDITAPTNNKGVLVPRLTNVQMTGIASPTNGLLVYNTDSAAFAYYTGKAWVYLKGNAVGANNWSTKGNAGTNPSQNFIGTTDNNDVIIKRNNILAGLISGDNYYNTSWGRGALSPTSTGKGNTAIGNNPLFVNTTGSSNTANGNIALYSNTTGSNNTAMGQSALYRNTSGYSNTAIGMSALSYNSIQSNLVAIGDSALYNNGITNNQGVSDPALSIGNTAVGSKALYNNTTGYYNMAVGYQAGYTNKMGKSNLFAGYQAGYQSNGNNNSYIGLQAGYANSSGSNNVFIGSQAGFNETGSNKLYITNTNNGVYDALIYGEFDNKLLRVNGKIQANVTAAGSTGLDLSTSDAYADVRVLRNTNGKADQDLYFGFGGTTNSAIHLYSNASEIMTLKSLNRVGINSTNPSANLEIRQNNANGTSEGIKMYNTSGSDSWSISVGPPNNPNLFFNHNGSSGGSGYIDNVTGFYVITSDRRLKKDIVTYKSSVSNKLMQLQAYQYHYLANKPDAKLSFGFMAQDVQKLFPDAVSEATNSKGETWLGINYQYFTMLAIKGLQEQQQQIDNLQQQIDELKKMIMAK